MRKALVITAVVVLVLGLGTFGLYQLTNSRTYQLFGELVHRVETPEKVVALTLDDGPTDLAPEVLRSLADLGVPATFYLNGNDLAARPHLGRQIRAAGHELGNHSYSHQRMALVGPEFVRREVEDTDRELRAAGQDGEITFRPPFGKKLWTLPSYLAEHDRVTVMWDVEPDSGTGHDAPAMVRAALEQTRPGSIILMHVMYPGRAPSRAALPGIVTGLRQQGYRFVTVSQLLKLRK
ncbi:polysaccharide deacetylase family protein [Allokutzneria sp. A3M-2-11 16]|uniref:polysaccharide deacetylase family protein n=1 Tax=Allokutzneria sp. A3M-2-11 16 TaxID=2962043 RepID=UPI0020B71690|nr:polysaccharide deacetylase family protein [Allokutzneria sp. A3M-2-11 16]MCP3804466.1 polysaccharide deacetylase family protein [Allokutzneria sp. A3M-2-11 16]